MSQEMSLGVFKHAKSLNRLTLLAQRCVLCVLFLSVVLITTANSPSTTSLTKNETL
jgi:hypothetical protein